MLLREMYERAPDGYYDPHDDNTSIKIESARKARITLAHLNKLRRVRDVRTVERFNSLEKIRKQYSTPPSEEGGGF